MNLDTSIMFVLLNTILGVTLCSTHTAKRLEQNANVFVLIHVHAQNPLSQLPKILNEIFSKHK